MADTKQPAKTEAPEELLIPIKQAADFAHKVRKTIHAWMSDGKLRWRDVDGRRMIEFRSLPPDAQERGRLWFLQNPRTPQPEQFRLLPEEPIDRQLAGLAIPRSELDHVFRCVRIGSMGSNHNWMAEGYENFGNFKKAVAAREKLSQRQVERIIATWKQNEDPLDFIRERTGPPPNSGTILDADMKANLLLLWRQGKTPQQGYVSLMRYLEEKARACRLGHHYRIPGRSTVFRYYRSLSALDGAARQGADALKAACGYISRSYRDVPSLGRVGVDEWITDVLAYDPRHASRVGRYYLLTFLDERSIYPLVWSLVEQPNEQEEINLLVRLIREFGIPGLINSDRGRFRGRTFGGRFISRDRATPERDGILDRLGVARNLPAEHNPRANRLERFFRQLADHARTLPGWCGCDTKQRRMTNADALSAAHKQWARTGQGEAPLLSRDQLLECLNKFMLEHRQRPSDGTDMDGFSPEAVFRQNTPAGGFRRISDEELAWKTAEHFDVLIRQGGIVQLRDGKSYFTPELLLIQGERREAVRLRHDHAQISVLPSAKDQPVIIAKRRARVGTNDPETLSAAMELQKHVRKLAGQFTKPTGYDPGSKFVEAPKSSDVIHPSEFVAAQEAPAAPLDYSEISSVEWQAKGRGPRPKPMDFPDLED